MEDNVSAKGERLRSRNKVYIRGRIASTIESVRGGYSFTVCVEEKHNGKTYPADIRTWVGSGCSHIMANSLIGDEVDLEGALRNDGHVVVIELTNISHHWRKKIAGDQG